MKTAVDGIATLRAVSDATSNMTDVAVFTKMLKKTEETTQSAV